MGISSLVRRPYAGAARTQHDARRQGTWQRRGHNSGTAGRHRVGTRRARGTRAHSRNTSGGGSDTRHRLDPHRRGRPHFPDRPGRRRRTVQSLRIGERDTRRGRVGTDRRGSDESRDRRSRRPRADAVLPVPAQFVQLDARLVAFEPQMRQARQRISDKPAAARSAEDWLTLAEVSMSYDGRIAALEAASEARKFRLTAAQRARLDLIDALSAGANCATTRHPFCFPAPPRDLIATGAPSRSTAAISPAPLPTPSTPKHRRPFAAVAPMARSRKRGRRVS